MKSKLQKLQVVIERAKVFANKPKTSPYVKLNIIKHAAVCSQVIQGLNKNLDDHTPDHCWALGKGNSLKKRTRENTKSLEESVGMLGLDCNIGLQSVDRCDPVDTKKDSLPLQAMKKRLLNRMYPTILDALIRV
ncbi:hypothetical protein CORC01_10606 [Colletotrichum orchidophilum]|uniref:Uncharacterized protein n=1 Tax=Colletotrichum orchidophilum TaxID=1209926 RepID=A0A1G4AYA8_9PEZI|nr:uncharacterized protein CORC01_10606 [Colletotrichum orchidophilum]OHE94149.1 hypothetical protein CORC01_10606 [Colletotrichum orchidophilum]